MAQIVAAPVIARATALPPALVQGDNQYGLSTDLAGNLRITGSVSVSSFPGTVDVSDRAARLLGVITSITNPVAVTGPLTDAQLRALAVAISATQFPAALVGGRLDVNVGASAGIDVTDRVGRLLGIVASITAPVDVSDRVARALGVIANLPAALVGGRLDTNIGAWLGSALPTVGQKVMTSSIPVTLASDQTTLPAVAEMRRSDLHITGTAAVNTALTITLPAPAAGLFHYITSIQWFKKYSIIGVAAGAGIIVTSTNLPGNPAWDTEQLASAAGTVVKVIDYQPTTPLKSAVAATATTIVAPLQLQTIWRGNVSYFTAA